MLGSLGLQLPGGARRRHARIPKDPDRHDRRSERHEPSRAVARGEGSEATREEDQEQGPGNRTGPCGGRRVPERALLKKGQVVEGGEGAVDQQGRDVGHREVAGAEKLRWDQRMGGPHHPDGQGDHAKHANSQGDVSDRVAPGALLTVDRAKREAADGQRDDHRADPVEMRGRLLIPAFRNVLPGRPCGHDHERDVDEECRPPRDGVDQQPAEQRPEDRRRS